MAVGFSVAVSAVMASRFLELSPSRRKRLYPSIKRCLDVTVALMLAPVAVPVVCALAIPLKIQGGSAFFCQKRVGMNGREFDFWKLRTMVPDAQARLESHLLANADAFQEWNTTQKLKKDPRITPLGRYLRKYSLDELPQLFNVLIGDMSIVGPRPIMPCQREHYAGSAYFDLRPGLTGAWQVSDRNSCSFAERASHDTNYAASMSFLTDMLILFRTPMAVLRGTGY